MKRIVALSLSVILLISLFAGCKRETANPTPTPTEEPDIVTSASPKESSDPAEIKAGLSADGFWIFSILSDVTLDEALYVEGKFFGRDNAAAEPYRKLALYAQDENRNITARYTLTVPQMYITSPGFRIQEGTVAGDVYVDADGFDLFESHIEGNLTFATQEQMDSASFDSDSVTGNISVE